MRASDACFQLIRRSESFAPRVYLDCLGYATIGYGHRLLQPDSFADGINKDLAEHILSCDVDDAAEAVERLVKVPLTQGQFDALTDFCFNLGEERLARSTLLRDLNAGHYDLAGQQLLLWVHGHKDGHVVTLPGLIARRKAEFDLWHAPAPNDPATAALAA